MECTLPALPASYIKNFTTSIHITLQVTDSNDLTDEGQPNVLILYHKVLERDSIIKYRKELEYHPWESLKAFASVGHLSADSKGFREFPKSEFFQFSQSK